MHGRALLGTCKPCYKKGDKMIIEQLKDNFIEIFGAEEYNRVLNDIKNEKDSYFYISKELATQIEHEDYLEQNNINPIIREGRGSYKND